MHPGSTEHLSRADSLTVIAIGATAHRFVTRWAGAGRWQYPDPEDTQTREQAIAKLIDIATPRVKGYSPGQRKRVTRLGKPRLDLIAHAAGHHAAETRELYRAATHQAAYQLLLEVGEKLSDLGGLDQQIIDNARDWVQDNIRIHDEGIRHRRNQGIGW